MQLLTNSRAKDARACARLHHLKFELGYRSLQESSALRFGTLWHTVMEDWWRASTTDRLTAAMARLEAEDQGDIDPFDRGRVVELLRGYTARWGEADYQTLRVEAEFRAPLVNPETGAPSRTWELGGKIDLIVAAHGREFIGEHKTSSEDIGPGSEYWRRLKLDGQIGMYYEGAKRLGHDVHGCLYDVVRKPAIRPLRATPHESRKFTKDGTLYANQRLKDETPVEFGARLRDDITADPAKYFQRGEVVRLDDEMADFMHDIWGLARGLRESELAHRWPRNPDSCVRYGRLCGFFPVCCGEAELTDETLYRQSYDVHPELTAPLSKEEMDHGTNDQQQA